MEKDALRTSPAAYPTQVNRLKTVKRMMYGRAKFDLLRKRVLHAARHLSAFSFTESDDEPPNRVNFRLELRWAFTQVPRRGRRRLETRRFALSRLIAFVRRALERHYGFVHEIVALAAPRP